jgi:outer membrane protein TolC
MNDVYSRRNDVNSLVLATKIYDEKAKVARAEMMPTVAAIGAAHTSNPNMYNGFKNRFGFGFSIGAVVKIPLWHWGGLSNKYKEAQAEARLKRVELENAKEKIELQVAQANFRYDEALKTYEATKSNLNEANENLRIAEIGFKEGVGTADDVLKAQTAWLKAHSEEVDAEIDVRMCDVYLSKVLGKMNY